MPVEKSHIADARAMHRGSRNIRVPPRRIVGAVQLLVRIAQGKRAAVIVGDGREPAQVHRLEGHPPREGWCCWDTKGDGSCRTGHLSLPRAVRWLLFQGAQQFELNRAGKIVGDNSCQKFANAL